MIEDIRKHDENFNEDKFISKVNQLYLMIIDAIKNDEIESIEYCVSRPLYRKLYYTAITRSRKKLIIVGDINALSSAAINNNQDVRLTTIKDKIIKKYSI